MPIQIPIYSIDQAPSSQHSAQSIIADKGLHEFAVVVDYQTNGLGRQGRVWWSKMGNLSFSLVSFIAPEIHSYVPLILGLSVLESLEKQCPNIRNDLSLKWPNDVLLNKAKVCGILISAIQDPKPYLIMGIGVNIAHAPEGMPYAVTSLSEHGVNISAKILAETIVETFQKTISNPDFSIPSILDKWMHRAHPIGSSLQVRHTQNIIAGHFAGLALDGSLLLDTDAGQQQFYSADCFWDGC